MRALILAAVLLTFPAQAVDWSHVQMDRSPIKLRDCYADASFTVSYNSGAYSPWINFCYGDVSSPSLHRLARRPTWRRIGRR